jgi:hypothetical protein
LDGSVLELGESVGREGVKVIVGEVVLSVSVASHAVEPALSKAFALV